MKSFSSFAGAVVLASSACGAQGEAGGDTPSLLALHRPPHLYLEEVHVEGQQQRTADSSVPTTHISAVELESINVSTVEDVLGYEPNLTVRRRYIGDANGSVGIRGSNMFQTARTLVYADGLPLHYHLQTRWSGAPRWSLIAPNEVASVDVVYGPFSAAYSGNAMGGVIRIQTVKPTERSVKLQGALFRQQYDQLATEEDYNGRRLSASYGDKLGEFTIFAFYNHLRNESQPMNQYFSEPIAPGDAAQPVAGAIEGQNAQGNRAIYYGDSGPEVAATDLLKVKTGYSWNDFELLTTLAYEDRSGQANEPNNFLSDENDNRFWGGEAMAGPHSFTVNPAHFAVHEQQRRSLLLGSGLSGPIGDDWTLDLNLSHFAVLDDEQIQSNHNPADPAYTTTGRVTAYDDTGWTTADINASTGKLNGNDQMSLLVGLHWDHYQLELDSFTSANYQAAERTTLRSTSGGQTVTQALFAEYAWQFHPMWDLTIGGRYEHWQAKDGFVDYEQHPDRSVSGFSPKFSVGHSPATAWTLRYSLARALRFPLVEELYQNESRANAVQTANAGLQPEDGIHHNLMIERALGHGFARVNLFTEKVEDTIFNQLGTLGGTEVSTFLAIDEVTTHGAELIINQKQLWDKPLDMRFNVSYLDAEVTRNSVNPAVEGKRFPRLPRWQSNLLLTYRFHPKLNFSSGLRYASSSYGALNNEDTAEGTFGAHDSYLFLNLRTKWQVNKHLDLALGVDNATDEVAYVHHPWPSRTFYLEAGYDF